ncbi:hypothetical protein [Spirosoma pulveris]
MHQQRRVSTRFVSLTKALRRGVLSLFLLCSVLLFVYAIYAYINWIPTADLTITQVGLDSTFYVGNGKPRERYGGHLFLRATGELDDSTALVLIHYPTHSTAAMSCPLPKGRFDRVWQGYFDDSRAKISFQHHRVKRGKVRLQIVFTNPPISRDHQ